MQKATFEGSCGELYPRPSKHFCFSGEGRGEAATAAMETALNQRTLIKPQGKALQHGGDKGRDEGNNGPFYWKNGSRRLAKP